MRFTVCRFSRTSLAARPHFTNFNRKSASLLSDHRYLRTIGSTETLKKVMEATKAERSESFGVPVPIPIVYSWGRSDLGNLFRKPDEEAADGVYQFQSTRTIISVSSNVYHSAAVTSTGELYTCGENYDGQVAPKSTTDASESTDWTRPRILELLGGQQRITSVSCGLTHTVCVTSSGRAISFGGNESGQLGHTPTAISNVAPKIVTFHTHSTGGGSAGSGGQGGLLIKKAACGDLFSLFLTTSGEVYGCGSAAYLGNSQTGKSGEDIVRVAQRIEALTGTHVVEVVSSSGHALVLTGTGEVYGWGDNAQYQLGYASRPADPTALSDAGRANTQVPQSPHRVEGLSDAAHGRVIGISTGYQHTLLWTDRGVLLGAGSNKYGQLALPLPRAEVFTPIPLPHGCIQAACGTHHSLVLCRGSARSAADSAILGPPLAELATESTVLYGFGSNSNNQITSAVAGSMFRAPQLLETIGSRYSTSKIAYIAAGGDQSFAIGMPDGRSAIQPAPGSLLRKQFSTVVSKAAVTMSAQALMAQLLPAKASMVGADGKPLAAPGDQKLLSMALNAASEIYSTPSLLAGSFQCPPDSEQGIQQHNAVTSAQRALQLSLLRKKNREVYEDFVSYRGASAVDPTAVYAHLPDLATDLAQVALPEELFVSKIPLLDIAGIEQCYVTLMQLGSTATARLLAAMQQSITELEYAAAHIAPGSCLPDSALRVLMILWQAPIMAVPTLSSHIFPRLLKIAKPLHQKLQTIFAVYPKHIFASRLLKPLHAHLAYALQFDAGRILESNDTPLLCDALQWLHEANSVHHIVSPEAFYNEKLATVPETTLISDWFHWRKTRDGANQSTPGAPAIATPPFLISRYPFLLSVEIKKKLLLIEDQMLMNHYQQESLRLAILCGATTVQPFFFLSIEREHLLQQALVHVAQANPLELRKPLKVSFVGEEGIDAGGVTKEFFQLLNEQLFAPQYGMFLSAPNGRCTVINMCNTYSEAEYRLVGVMLGLAVYNNVILDVHFPPAMYKLLLGRDVNLDDVSAIDPALYKGLLQLLQFEPAEQVEDVYCRYFATEWDNFGAKMEHDLIPDGRNVPVTGATRYAYADKLVQWALKESIAAQFTALREGFHTVVNADSLLLLTPEELQQVMVGTPHLDFRELQLHTQYTGPENWNAENPTVCKFWRILHDLPFEEKQKFLLFVTGSSKAPLGGLKNVNLTIQRMGPHSNMLPTAHTCFNTLLLPEYDCDAPAPAVETEAAVPSQVPAGSIANPAALGDASTSNTDAADGSATSVAERSAVRMDVVAEPAPADATSAASTPRAASSPVPAAIGATALPSPPPSPPRRPQGDKSGPGNKEISTEEFMRERLLKAISECEGFGLK